MTGGFTYGGVDIADLGFEYAPDNQNTYVYKAAQFTMNEQTVESHDGGYFFGAVYKPKDFVLRCIYQDTHLLSGALTRLYTTFRRGRTAKLVFQKRPWCWYMATVVSVDTAQMTNYMNGMVTITLRAHYPFARSDQTYITAGDPYEDDLVANSAMLYDASIGPGTDYAASEEITAQKTIRLYNPGTERCKVAIEIAGDVGEGVTVANATTDQSCEFKALTKAITTAQNKYIVCDALNGKVLLTNGQTHEYGFLYHDNGFIELESSFPAVRGIKISGAKNATSITTSETLTGDLVGRYIRLNDGTYEGKILSVSGNSLTMDTALPAQATNAAATMLQYNEIIVTPSSSMALTRLVFRYLPTFA